MREKVFTKIPGRQHSTFRDFSRDPFLSLEENPTTAKEEEEESCCRSSYDESDILNNYNSYL